MYGGDVHFDSAGTNGFHNGQKADKRSVQACHRHGVDISQCISRQINKKDFNKFDLIVALEQSVLKTLQKMKPAKSTAKLALLNAPRGIADPYYGSDAAFDKMYTHIEQVMPDFLKQQSVIQDT